MMNNDVRLDMEVPGEGSLFFSSPGNIAVSLETTFLPNSSAEHLLGVEEGGAGALDIVLHLPPLVVS